MKKVKLKIPSNLEGTLVNWIIDNNINVVLSYLVQGDLFTPDYLVIYLTVNNVSEETEVKKWEKYFQKM